MDSLKPALSTTPTTNTQLIPSPQVFMVLQKRTHKDTSWPSFRHRGLTEESYKETN